MSAMIRPDQVADDLVEEVRKADSEGGINVEYLDDDAEMPSEITEWAVSYLLDHGMLIKEQKGPNTFLRFVAPVEESQAGPTT